MQTYIEEALSLKHQEILTPLWKRLCVKHSLQYSEYSFADNFLFRRQHAYAFIPSDPPFVRGTFKTGQFYFIPTCPPSEIKMDLIRCLAEKSAMLYPIPEQWHNDFLHLHPTITSCRADSDYLFTSEKLKTLPGRDLSSRRNLITQLTSNHTMAAKTLTAEHFGAARSILAAWQHNTGQPETSTDFIPCQEAFEYFEQLNLFGRIIYADNIPMGFAIGENITPKTVQMIFAKTLHEFKGATPFLYQDFALHLPPEVEWVNLEQDLGLTSLRKAKEAFSPDKLLAKWRFSFGCEHTC